MNLIHTPLYFNFLDYTGPNSSRAWEQNVRSKDTRTLLESKGIHDLASDRFGQLRLNKWFGDILKSGKDETNEPLSQLTADEIGEFPDEVALQCFLHVNQNLVKENHSFKNTLLEFSGTPGSGGDLGYHLHNNKIVHSPFGIAAFNMGRGVELSLIHI